MNGLAVLFPGQGAQYVGMGRDLYDAFPSVRALYAEADERLGFPLSRYCFEGPAERLAETAITQPAILVTSLACLTALRERDLLPPVTATAGLSLGEYTALVLAGALPAEDAPLLVHRRGTYMQEAVPPGDGAMAAILGLEDEQVEAVCREATAAGPGQVWAANFNCPGQVVISGHTSAVERALPLAKARGAKRAVLLPVSAPFHCPLMAPAAQRLAVALEEVRLAPARIPVWVNATAEPMTRAEALHDSLIAQLTAPVRFEETIRRMAATGIDRFLEVGPGTALTGFVRRICPDAGVANVQDLPSLERWRGGIE